MKKIKIFSEGITDQIFIADCIDIFYGLSFKKNPIALEKNKLEVSGSNESFDVEIIDVGGCSKLKGVSLDILKDNSELGGVNIVVFDADFDGCDNGNKGFINCKNKLDALKVKKSVDFEYYIWPNNSDDGEVENLLEQLIPIGKRNVWECINSHHTCLKSLQIPDLRIPSLKEKIGFYFFTCNQETNLPKRNYSDANYWHLDHEKNQFLAEFKAFLDFFFTD